MIRSATIQDASSIAQIHVDAWKSAYKGILPNSFLEELNIQDRTSRWKKILEGSRSKTYILESTEKIEAWISYGLSRDDDCNGLGEIWALYVSPKNWRNGYGSALMKFIEEIARESKTTSLMLWVLKKNIHGRNFYERLGYTSDGATKKIEIGKISLEEVRYHKKVEPVG